MTENMNEKTSKSLMELSQKIDGIVLKLNGMEQQSQSNVNNKSGLSLQGESVTNTGRNSIDAMKRVEIDVNEDEDTFTVTEEDINEINAEMEELFGSPMSTIKT